MTKVLLDKPTLERLGGLSNPMILCDETGRVRGHFIPAVDWKLFRKVDVPFTSEELDRAAQEPDGRLLAELYRTAEVPFTEEELDRFEKEPGGRTLVEIMKDLEGR
jgi:hypothetical protein